MYSVYIYEDVEIFLFVKVVSVVIYNQHSLPGNMSAKRLPQLVILTFDDSVNDLNKGLYQVLSLTKRLFLYVFERE